MQSVKQTLVLACFLAAAVAAAAAPTAAAAEYASLAEAVTAASSTNNLSILMEAVQVSPIAVLARPKLGWAGLRSSRQGCMLSTLLRITILL
jgi:hypothetical protein